jgi:hypothetical protein
MRMSTTSKSETPVAPIVVGVLAAIGIAALVWAVVAHKIGEATDPLDEADRRIRDLENSLVRLQETIAHTVQG